MQITPRAADVLQPILFAPYQRHAGPPYDLTNTFERTNMAQRIIGAIQSLEGRLESVEWMHRKGLLSGADYLERSDEAAGRLRQHHKALNELGKLGSY